MQVGRCEDMVEERLNLMLDDSPEIRERTDAEAVT